MTDGAQVKRKKPWSPWTDEEHELLTQLSRDGVRPVVIAEMLGRSAAVVNKKRLDLGLVERTDICLECGTAITQAGVGRPRRHCSAACVALKAARAREARRQELIAARTEWTCLICGGPLRRDRASRKYCSNTCNKRAWYERDRASRATD